MGHWIRRDAPGNIGHRRVRTQVEEHTIADNPSSTAIVERDLSRSRSNEAALTHNQFYSSVCCALGVELMFRFDHYAFALLNAGHVDSELIHFQSEFSAAPRERRYSRGVDHVSCSASTRNSGTTRRAISARQWRCDDPHRPSSRLSTYRPLRFLEPEFRIF